MRPNNKPLGVADAAAQLAVVRSTLNVVLQVLVVMIGTFLLVGQLMTLLSVREGGIREIYEAVLTCIISMAILYQVTLRPLARLAAEHAAASAESRFQFVANTALDGILIFDENMKILFANKATEQIYGYARGSLLGMPMESLLPDDSKHDFREDIDTYVQSKASKVIGKGPTEHAGVRANGERFPVEISVSEMLVNNERQFVVVLREISARKAVEHELLGRTMRLNAVLANSPLGMVVLDEDLRVQMCNPAFEAVFQYRNAEIAGLNIDSLLAPEEMINEASRMSKQGMQGEVVHAITQRRRKDGSLVDVELHGVPLVIDGRLEGTYAIYQDITERKKLSLYEQILPVCCMCGRIRDDDVASPGEGKWDRLDHYIAKHSDAKLSHTFCPPCLEQYRKQEGIK